MSLEFVLIIPATLVCVLDASKKETDGYSNATKSSYDKPEPYLQNHSLRVEDVDEQQESEVNSRGNSSNQQQVTCMLI